MRKVEKMNEAAKRVYAHVKADYPLKKLLPIMGYSAKTHCNRMDNPTDFTLAQLRILYEISDVTDREFMRMIRDDKDARSN